MFRRSKTDWNMLVQTCQSSFWFRNHTYWEYWQVYFLSFERIILKLFVLNKRGNNIGTSLWNPVPGCNSIFFKIFYHLHALYSLKSTSAALYFRMCAFLSLPDKHLPKWLHLYQHNNSLVGERFIISGNNDAYATIIW